MGALVFRDEDGLADGINCLLSAAIDLSVGYIDFRCCYASSLTNMCFLSRPFLPDVAPLLTLHVQAPSTAEASDEGKLPLNGNKSTSYRARCALWSRSDQARSLAR